jgi:hypothetical protein
MAPKLLWKERTAAVLARNQRVVVVFPKRLVTMLSEHGLGEIAVQHCGEGADGVWGAAFTTASAVACVTTLRFFDALQVRDYFIDIHL